MSRTDKDMPHWVTATWWEPRHWRCDEAPAHGWTASSDGQPRACDLPAEPHVAWTDGWLNRRCVWLPIWERLHFPNPPHWYINHVWNASERLAARVDCLKAAKEYRGDGRVETDPTVRQARHGARWLWW